MYIDMHSSARIHHDQTYLPLTNPSHTHTAPRGSVYLLHIRPRSKFVASRDVTRANEHQFVHWSKAIHTMRHADTMELDVLDQRVGPTLVAVLVIG